MIPIKRFTGKHMLIIMLCFFGVILAVNLTLATLAAKSWSGLVVKNSYVASQNFNEKLSAAARQAQTGWQSRLTQSGGGLELYLSERGGAPLAGLNVTAVIRHPINEQLDRKTLFRPQAPGRYRSDLRLPVGLWEIEIRAARGAQPAYIRIFRIQAKG